MILTSITNVSFIISLVTHDILSCVGISFSHMHKHFHGEVVYNAETDIHFPKLVR
jgi:hypothetical protein